MRTANGQDDYMSVKYGKTSGMRPAGAAGAKAGCGCRKALIEFFIHLVWVVLEIVNVILVALQAISGAIENCLSSYDKKPKHVVIVGASFGGLAAQRELAGRKDVKVTLIDFKKYFEYTPGVLRCFVQPEFLKELTCPLPSTRNELLTGTMTGCSEEAVTLRTSTGGEQKVSFDYLVLAVGSTYSDPIKPTEAETTLAERTSSWGVAANKLANAQTVIVVGAGPVGVELAGEILTVYPDKTVTFVDMAPTILPGFDEAAATFTKQWFKDRGAKMMLGEAIEKIGERRMRARPRTQAPFALGRRGGTDASAAAARVLERVLLSHGAVASSGDAFLLLLLLLPLPLPLLLLLRLTLACSPLSAPAAHTPVDSRPQARRLCSSNPVSSSKRTSSTSVWASCPTQPCSRIR